METSRSTIDSRSIISSHGTKPRSALFPSTSLLKMTRSSPRRRIKVRKLGRKLKGIFKARPLSNASYHTPPQDLRNVKSVYSLKPVRDLAIHYVSEPTPAPLSIRHRSVRFTHPAVRHVISALPTPLSTARGPIPECLGEYGSPANVDFPGQVNISVIRSRRSYVTNSVLYEEIFDQLDGVLAHPRDSKLLQRRGEKERLDNQRRSTMVGNSNAQNASKAWPLEGICGTNPIQPTTKSGLRALQYLSFHAPIQEEAFSDEAIFGTTTDAEQTREQHVKATLDLLSRPQVDVNLQVRATSTSGSKPDVHVRLPHDQEKSTRLPYLAFHTSFRPNTTVDPAQSDDNASEADGKQPANQHIRHNLDWEKALRTVQQRNSTSGIASPPALARTPDFPSTQSTAQKRRTLLQSTALDLNLTTPASISTAITPCFPVLNAEREIHRRTFIGEQQRDLALTPAVQRPAVKTLPRTFSIPRRGVGQPAKAQVVSGLPLVSSQSEMRGSDRAFHAAPVSNSCSVAQPTLMNTDQRRGSSIGSGESSQVEFPMRPKRSRMEVLRKIVTKNY